MKYNPYFIINERDDQEISPQDSSHQDGKLARIMGELGRISQSSRSLGWKEARESYRQSLDALFPDYFVPWSLIQEFRLGVDAFVGGDEHLNLRIPSEPNRIYKVTSNDQFGCSVFFDPHDLEITGRNFLARGNDDPWFYLERWRLLNSIGDYQTRLEGLISPARSGWLPRFCVSQPVLPGENPTQDEITESLAPFGFFLVSAGAYYSPEQKILLTDTFPRNVRIQNGIPGLFDAIASTPSLEASAWLSKKLA